MGWPSCPFLLTIISLILYMTQSSFMYDILAYISLTLLLRFLTWSTANLLDLWCMYSKLLSYNIRFQKLKDKVSTLKKLSESVHQTHLVHLGLCNEATVRYMLKSLLGITTMCQSISLLLRSLNFHRVSYWSQIKIVLLSTRRSRSMYFTLFSYHVRFDILHWISMCLALWSWDIHCIPFN